MTQLNQASFEQEKARPTPFFSAKLFSSNLHYWWESYTKLVELFFLEEKCKHTFLNKYESN